MQKVSNLWVKGSNPFRVTNKTTNVKCLFIAFYIFARNLLKLLSAGNDFKKKQFHALFLHFLLKKRCLLLQITRKIPAKYPQKNRK